MDLINIFIGTLVAGMAVIPFLKQQGQRIALFLVVLFLAGISGLPALQSLTGNGVEMTLPGNVITGTIPLRLDALSGWFILIISLIFITGLIYGFTYLKPYNAGKNNLTLHYLSFLLLYSSLISLCVIQNSLVFLIVWEIMTLSAFVGVIFEHQKEETLRAGINFLIQSHVSVLFLITGFIGAFTGTGSYDFAAFADLSRSYPSGISMMLLICFIIGFGIKAGFVPFHTWLPYAHPAAPAHISGIMSGVMIKIGIFGILRFLLLMPVDYQAVGYLLLAVSAISGLYGVMLAIVQHNLKKLLAYHSVENIGIIGMGIGIGCIGMGTGNLPVIVLGFAGALLHTLNHALFKSLLFYATGIVYQAAHTLDVEHLGGLIRKMPQTAILFLIAAIAICGLPPFNGFISEFVIYTGLYQWLINASPVPSIVALLVILSLVLIGGMALLCFTKAFGIVFLGSPRKDLPHEVHEAPLKQLLPLYLIAFLIACIGLFPQFFFAAAMAPVNLFTGKEPLYDIGLIAEITRLMQTVSYSLWGVILLSGMLFFIRKMAISKKPVSTGPTWGCGYATPTAKLQYTASSFVRSYRKLNNPVLFFSQKKKEIDSIFPEDGHYESHAGDKLEKWLIDKPVHALRSFLGHFLFLQNGRLQSYLLYGILFILGMIFLPMIMEKLISFFGFLKQL